MSRREMDQHRKELPIGGVVPTVLSAVDVGSGPQAALCVHGAGGNLLQWHNQVGYFQDRMRMAAFDMRGHGESQKPMNSRYEFEEFVDDLELVVDALEMPERFFLLSHSFGGAVAAAYAVRHPERLLGLVLMATSGEIPLGISVQILMKLPASMLSGVQHMVRHAISTPPGVMKKLVPMLVRYRGWDLYPRISTPTLVISGEYDMLTRPEPMRRLADLIPDSSFERVHFAAHMPQLERPQRINQVLERFLIPDKRVGWRPGVSP